MEKNTASVRGKDDDRKLFVGGLPRLCIETDIRTAFSEFGTIESINMKIDPYTNISRGFCFIVFAEPESVEKALHADVVIRSKKVDPRRVTKTPGKIFIGGISAEITEERLREYFQQYGKITEIQWPYDRTRNQRRSYCFILYETKEAVDEALKNPKQNVDGNELDVKRVKYNPETMWAGYARVPRGWAPYPFHPIDYREDYSYEECYGMESGDPYYDCYAAGYDAYPPHGAYQPYPQRAPRGGRSGGGYSRHAPY